MSDFLTTLKERLAASQLRLAQATAKLQIAQQEHQRATQEFISWQNAVNVESHQVQPSLPIPMGQNIRLGGGRFVNGRPTVVTPATLNPQNVIVTPAEPVQPVEQPKPIQPIAPPEEPTVNKSELVREALQQYPGGAKAVQIWKQVKDQVPRAYTYSVLRRLKDRKLATQRKGKYYPVAPQKGDDTEELPAVMVQ